MDCDVVNGVSGVDAGDHRLGKWFERGVAAWCEDAEADPFRHYVDKCSNEESDVRKRQTWGERFLILFWRFCGH